MPVPLLLALVLLAPLAGRAQAPVALNGPIPGARAARLLDVALFPGERGAGGEEADTTSPWRYFPLHVGDVWEYYRYQDGALERRVVTGTTVYEGRRYFRLDVYFSHGSPPVLSSSRRFRFDTLSARVLEPYVDGERMPQDAPCPFDPAFGSTAQCTFGPMAVTGGYDGRLVLGGSLPGTGTDTLTVAYKRFDALLFDLEYRFAADFGFGYLFNGKSGEAWGLTFARVNGVAHGLERFPCVGTAAEPVPGPPGVLALSVAPNPARGWARASFSLPGPAPVALAVYDALGRGVLARDLGTLPAGRHEAALDLAGLAPGLYVARAVTAGGAVTARLVVAR